MRRSPLTGRLSADGLVELVPIAREHWPWDAWSVETWAALVILTDFAILFALVDG